MIAQATAGPRPPRVHLSRFTPSLMLPETLEAVFVQRQELAVDTVARIRESALTGNKHYLLYIGPRGCGKTHFVSLIYHRLKKIAELRDPLRIAWLTEDETSTSFLDVQLRVYRALSRGYPAEFPPEALERLYEFAPDRAADLVSKAIIDRLGKRSGLVIVENLDQLFDDIGRDGQHEWRAFLQETGRFSILATAQQLFPGVSDRDAPFFGSFQTAYFEALLPEQGMSLLMNIARLNKDTDLQRFLSSARGRARVRALHHLSGGNHRVYVVLSEFINAKELDQLIRPFEKMLDELTPYYQERLRWLSAQQRKIVEYLCTSERPMTVNEIARSLFATNQTISRQLKDLKEKRYVRAATRGRESLYELTEPLMRMAMELKEHRGGPIRLIVDFLRVWYDRVDLDVRLLRLSNTAVLERAHLTEALRCIDSGAENPCVSTVLREVERLEAAGNSEQIIEALEELAETRGSAEDWERMAIAKLKSGDLMGAVDAATRAAESEKATPDQRSVNVGLRAIAKCGLGDLVGARDDFSRVIGIEGAEPRRVPNALRNRGILRRQLGDINGAISDYTQVIESNVSPVAEVAEALNGRALARCAIGDIDGELEDYDRVIAMEEAPIEATAVALCNRGVAMGSRRHFSSALTDFSSAIELSGASARGIGIALNNRAATKRQLGDLDGAFEDFRHVLRLDEVPTEVLAIARNGLAVCHCQLREFAEAMNEVTRSLQLCPNLAEANYTRAEVLLTSGEWNQGWAGLADCLDRFPLQTLEPEAVELSSLIRIVFESSSGGTAWQSRVEKLVELHAHANGLSILGDALVRNVGELAGDKTPPAELLADWCASWHAAGNRYEELALALRLFDVAIDYVTSRDPKTLLDLPLEQRALLEQMFGVQADEEG